MKKLNHFQASVELANRTGDMDTNWSNVLQENRRSGSAFDKAGNYIIKGNHHLYGYIPFEIIGGKSYYSLSVIERLAKAILAKRAGSTLTITKLIKAE